jgi:hypothetical protein
MKACSDLQLPGFHFTGGFASHSTVANADVNVVKLPEAISFTDVDFVWASGPAVTVWAAPINRF